MVSNLQSNSQQPDSPLSQNSQFLAFVAGREERSDSQLWNDLIKGNEKTDQEETNLNKSHYSIIDSEAAFVSAA